MQSRPQPYFSFPVVAHSEQFVFEPIGLHHAQPLAAMFASDTSPFTDSRFKSEHAAREYISGILEWGATSPKHGGTDWMVTSRDGTYIAILHLYDLSLESWNENDRRCWIGFAVHPAYRRKGVVTMLLAHLIRYIREAFPLMRYVHAMTRPHNDAAQATLRKAGFDPDDEDRSNPEYAFFILKLD